MRLCDPRTDGCRSTAVQRGVALEERDRQRTALRQELLDQRRELGNEGTSALGRKQLHARVSSFAAAVSDARVVFVTGLSGAGKSQAMKIFEDLGYYCIDRLPPALTAQALALVRTAGQTRVALTLDAPGSGALGDPVSAIEAARAEHAHVLVLFLEASDDVLIRRYSETRHRHPFAGETGLHEAIAAERRALAPLRERADAIIDTSVLHHAELRARLTELVATDGSVAQPAIVVRAFGFKYGLPLDADLVFDVRFLRNPNYEPALRERTGDDAAVAAYIEADAALSPFLRHLFVLLDDVVPRYAREGKSRLTLAFGCTGGRHRSVYVARRVAEHLRARGIADVVFDARDAARP